MRILTVHPGEPYLNREVLKAGLELGVAAYSAYLASAIHHAQQGRPVQAHKRYAQACRLSKGRP